MLVTNTRIRTSLTNFAQFVGSKNEKELVELFQDLLTDIAGGIVMTELALGDGSVSDLAIKFGTDGNNGFYGVSDTQLGVAVEGTLVAGANTLGLFTSNVAEQIVGVGVTVDGATARDGYIINKPTPAAINATAVATAAQLLSGVITSTSAAITAITLPSVASIVAILGNGRGSSFDFVIDNTLGASTVNVVLPVSITQLVNVPDGGAGLLTVAASATLGVGIFRIYFYSATAAVISRIA